MLHSVLAIVLLSTASGVSGQPDEGAPLDAQPDSQRQPTLPPPSVTPVPLPTRPPEPGDAADRLSFQLLPRATHTFAADLDDSPGEVAVTRAGLGLNIGYFLSERTRLSLGLDGEWSGYDFDNASGLVPGTSDPLDDAYTVSISPSFFHALNDQWSLIGGPSVRFSGEGGADVGDSATFGGFFGARYAVSERLSVAFGISGTSRLEDNALFVPLLGLEWKITDDVTLASEGLGLRLTAAVHEKVSIGATVNWFSREYRMEDDGPLPEGVARDSRVPVGGFIEFRPTESVSISLVGGVTVWQEFEFLDRGGEEVSEVNTDPAPYVGVLGTIRF